MLYAIVVATALVSFGFGWRIGYGQGRHIGQMIGKELERRRKWQRPVL
jgi:hypothetical protein